MILRLCLVLVIMTLSFGVVSNAKAESGDADSDSSTSKPKKTDDSDPEPTTHSNLCADAAKTWVTTQHQAVVGGKSVSYSTTVGFLEVILSPNSAKPAKGCVFFSAYQLKKSVNASPRPLTFAFNGGPGSASLWLHLGLMAPKRVDLGNDGLGAPLPFQLRDNEDSPLDLTDIVMIDPIATGFSRATGGSKNSDFFGAKNDSISVATFIRDFLDRFSRRSSQVFVMGESYGGVRGSLVAQHLQKDFNIPVKGLILISPYLSSTTINFDEDDNDTPFVSFLPNYATTAWYHKRAAKPYQALDVASVYKAARTFANGRYRAALAQGNGLDPAEFEAVAQVVSDFTGISKDQVAAWNLRIQDTQYFAGLLNRGRQTIGRFDSRFVGQRLLHQDGSSATDPSDQALGFAFVSAINSYIRNDLGFSSPTPYFDSASIDSWPYDSDGDEFSVTRNLSQAMLDNPRLQVFVASGYYDLACPMGAVEFERERLDPSVNPNRMVIHRYEAGHMVYINPAVLHQLKQDLASYYSELDSKAVVPQL